MANGTLQVSNIQTSSGSGTITIGQSGETVTVPNGLLSGQNYPAFEAYQSAVQTGAGDATWTKLTMNTETFDTDSMYDASTNYRFTPTVAGKYFVYLMAGMYSETSNKLNVANVAIYKNGSSYKMTNTTFNSGSDIANEHNAVVTAIIDFNGSSDYVEPYVRSNVTSGTSTLDARLAPGAFGAYKIGA